MAQLNLFLFLFAKHGLLANKVDIGYSEARGRHTLAVCWLYLCYQLLTEALGSFFILGGCVLLGLVTHQGTFQTVHHIWRWETFLLAEMFGQILAWAYERHAPMQRLLLAHLTAELSFLALYAMLAALLYPF
jgi:hypothetical protein